MKTSKTKNRYILILMLCVLLLLTKNIFSCGDCYIDSYNWMKTWKAKPHFYRGIGIAYWRGAYSKVRQRSTGYNLSRGEIFESVRKDYRKKYVKLYNYYRDHHPNSYITSSSNISCPYLQKGNVLIVAPYFYKKMPWYANLYSTKPNQNSKIKIGFFSKNKKDMPKLLDLRFYVVKYKLYGGMSEAVPGYKMDLKPTRIYHERLLYPTENNIYQKVDLYRILLKRFSKSFIEKNKLRFVVRVKILKFHKGNNKNVNTVLLIKKQPN